jgi:hypothetical protein
MTDSTVTIRGVTYINCRGQAALPRARVTLETQNFVRHVRSDDRGRFTAMGLPAGEYAVLLETREGVAKRQVRVEPGDIATLGLGYDAPHSGGQCTTVLARAEMRTQDTTTMR